MFRGDKENAVADDRTRNALQRVIETKACDDNAVQELAGGLDWLVSAKLRAAYPDWEWETLDGILCSLVTVVSGNAVEILGLCILMSDQATTPIRLLATLSEHSLEVTGWVGEAGEVAGGMRRYPYDSPEMHRTHRELIAGRPVDWVYSF